MMATDRVSDPSPLTTAQLQREVSSLKELFTQRMDAVDEAIKVAHENLTRVPTEVDKAIGHLREVLNGKLETVAEKFASVQTQFQERDVRVEQTARDTKVAVDAALQAAEKAVGKQNEASSLSIAKSEAATMKQIDQQGLLITTSTQGLDSKINDVKERLTRIEGEDRGQKVAKTTQETSNTSMVGIISLVVGTLIGIGGLVVAFIGHPPSGTPQVVYLPAPVATTPAK